MKLSWKVAVNLGVVSGELAHAPRLGQITVCAWILDAFDHGDDCACPALDCVQVWVQVANEEFIADAVDLIPAEGHGPRRLRPGFRLEMLKAQTDPDGNGPFDHYLPFVARPDRGLCGVYPLRGLTREWWGQSVIARAHVGDERYYSEPFDLPLVPSEAWLPDDESLEVAPVAIEVVEAQDVERPEPPLLRS
jgi:hypothetical protein